MPVTVHLASVPAVARFSVLLGTHCRARCSTPREIRIQNFTFLDYQNGTRIYKTRAPADSNTSISVTGPIFT